MSDPSPLRPLREDRGTALCVVAHPDDLEFGAAAAVARWTGQGKRVVYCLVTSGEADIDSVPPEECGPLREAEQVAAARLVGVEEVEFLRLPDGVLEHGVDLRARIAHVVRRQRPDVVVTGNHHDTWDRTTRNSADHVAVGRSALDAVADAGNRWMHREQMPDGLQPWAGSVRCASSAHRCRPTRWRSPPPSTPASPRSRRTAPTSTGSGGGPATPAGSWRTSP